MSARTSAATREAPPGDEQRQPVSREGQAGPGGGAERPAVPRKPGNAGGGKGPQLGTNVRRSKGPGDWREPSNSHSCSGAPDGVACQSEGITDDAVLLALRQGVPGGCPDARLRPLP